MSRGFAKKLAVLIRTWLLIGLLAFGVNSSYAVPPITTHANSPTTAKNQLQMWNLQDADIRGVIQMISQLTGKDFIVDPRVQGKITVISSKPMTVGEMYHVFLSMLQVLNYAAIPAGHVIKIIPAMQAKEYGGTLTTGKHPGFGDEVVVRIVTVDNISAIQLVPVLRPLMQEWGSINAYAPSNTLILAGSAANVNRLVTIIHDNSTQRGTITITDPAGNTIEDGEAGVRRFLGTDF